MAQVRQMTYPKAISIILQKTDISNFSDLIAYMQSEKENDISQRGIERYIKKF